MMKLQILFFAGLAEKLGRHELAFEAELAEPTVSGLILQLKESLAEFEMDGVRVAVDEEFVDLEHQLSGSETVAFIPPVSGG